MPTKKTCFITITVLAVLLTSCQPRQRVRSATEKHYELKGKIVQVDKAQRTLMIAHEDIKDYMPAMTMPFTVKDDWVFEIAAPGNSITADYVVDGAQSWLEEVVITEGGVAEPGKEVEGSGPKIKSLKLSIRKKTSTASIPSILADCRSGVPGLFRALRLG